jgi:hypothetical protein
MIKNTHLTGIYNRLRDAFVGIFRSEHIEEIRPLEMVNCLSRKVMVPAPSIKAVEMPRKKEQSGWIEVQCHIHCILVRDLCSLIVLNDK